MTYVPAMNTIFHGWCLENSYKMTDYIPANVPGQQNMNMGKNNYTPAFCDTGRIKYGLSWWKDDCFFKYPYLLVSAAYGLEDYNFREKYEIPKDVWFLADSGGYQVATQGIDLDPLALIKWQERNADAGLILDVPPFESTDAFQLGTPKDFEKSLEKTKKNGDTMYGNQQDEDFLLYGVVQGETWDKLTTWYNRMKEDTEYKAWSIKPHPSNDVFKVAQAGIFALDKLDNLPFHMLMVSGVSTMAVCIYLSKYYKGHVTYDSSSYARGCIAREYTVPFQIGQSFNFGNTKGTEHRITELPCICPVCSKIKAEELWQSGSLPGALIALHNLYWYITYSKTLNALLADDDMFMKFVRSVCSDKAVKAIEMIDHYMDTKDAERTINKYRPYMSVQSKRVQGRFRI